MEKKETFVSDTSIPDPLNIFAKTIGRRIQDQGDKSKETVKEMLITTLIPEHRQCVPFTTKPEVCDEVNDKLEKGSEKDSDTDKDKKVEECVQTELDISKEEVKEEDESECSSSDMTEEIELSFDGKWLKEHFQIPLKMAIKEIVAKKPYDPVGYLGFWLLHYKRCQERNQWLLEKDHELKYLRSLIQEPESEVVTVSMDRGEEEEETRDWNYEHYNAMQSLL